MDIKYSYAGEKDIPLLLELIAEFYLIEHLPYDSVMLKKGLKKLFGNDAYGKLRLIYDEDKPIGYILVTFGFSLEFHGTDALVDEFYIREAYRGKGIGFQTLKLVEDDLKGLGIKAIHLVVNSKNIRAQNVYHKFSFESHDAYLMTKWIVEKK